MTNIFYLKYESPVGELFIYATKEKLVALTFKKNRAKILQQLKIEKAEEKSTALIRLTILQLKKYFRGHLRSFDIPIELNGTQFQMTNWNALRKIRFGETSTYKAQAQLIKKANAIRAVGAANAQNPLSIIVPCHRLIGTNGKLTGYAGGIRVKAALLAIEGHDRY